MSWFPVSSTPFKLMWSPPREASSDPVPLPLAKVWAFGPFGRGESAAAWAPLLCTW